MEEDLFKTEGMSVGTYSLFLPTESYGRDELESSRGKSS